MNRCGFGQCGGHFGGGGGPGWLEILDSLALWILAVAAILFLLGLRRRSRSWGRGPGGGAFRSGTGGPGPAGFRGWGGPAAAQGAVQNSGQTQGQAPVQANLGQAEANLAERFSRGEITADEYRGSLDVLRGQPQSWPQAQPGPAAYGTPEPPQPPAEPTAPIG
jgi:hypothetical protein